MPKLNARSRIREAHGITGRFPRAREVEVADLGEHPPLILEQCRGEFEKCEFLKSELVSYVLANCDPFQDAHIRGSTANHVQGNRLELQLEKLLEMWVDTGVLSAESDGTDEDPAYSFAEEE